MAGDSRTECGLGGEKVKRTVSCPLRCFCGLPLGVPVGAGLISLALVVDLERDRDCSSESLRSTGLVGSEDRKEGIPFVLFDRNILFIANRKLTGKEELESVVDGGETSAGMDGVWMDASRRDMTAISFMISRGSIRPPEVGRV